MTQLEKARNRKITKEMRFCSRNESVSQETVRKEIAKGRAVIPANRKHKNLKPIIIGEKFLIKINSNIGSSPQHANKKDEMKKLEVSLKYGADAVMDLSIGGNIDEFRRNVIKNSPVPVGTVPIYQAVADGKDIDSLSDRDFLKGIEKHIKDGVDFITVHAGLQKNCLPLLDKRLIGVVSRGGGILVRWMRQNNRENPLYESFDEILEMAYNYDVTLSLGDGLRPGSIHDATDKAQIKELKNLGLLTKRAWKENVQVMIEGPGHVPLNQIEKNMKLEKKYCHNAPFYVLGPLVTDIGAGHDHITAAIGGALAGYYGASFLCYVTPAEHLRLPEINDVREGIIATKIAAHSADIAKGNKKAIAKDYEMSKARKNFDWCRMFELAIDGEKSTRYRRESGIKEDVCTMCGKFCPMKVSNEKQQNKK